MPSSLAALQRLVVLDLSSNQLSGDLVEFAFVALDDRDDLNSRMRSFNASHNKLTGGAGAYIGSCRDLATAFVLGCASHSQAEMCSAHPLRKVAHLATALL